MSIINHITIILSDTYYCLDFKTKMETEIPLPNIYVQNVRTNQNTKLWELWNEKKIVLCFLRHLGCRFCQQRLRQLNTIKKKFPYPVGFSDNGDDLLVPEVAVSLGANIIEKHFTLDKKMKGPDHKLSANPKQMKQLISNIRKIEQIRGDGEKKTQNSEKESQGSIVLLVDAEVFAGPLEFSV